MVKQNESKVTTDQTWCDNLAHIWLLKKTNKKGNFAKHNNNEWFHKNAFFVEMNQQFISIQMFWNALNQLLSHWKESFFWYCQYSL